MPNVVGEVTRECLAIRVGRRLKSPEQAQRFVSVHAMIYGHVRPRRRLMTTAQHRRARATAFRVWRQETCVQATA